MNVQATVELPKKAKGDRPYFFADSSVDKVLAMLMGLMGEVSVLADRVETLEHLLTAQGVLKEGQVGSFRPDAEARAVRDERREMLLANVLRIIRQDAEAPEALVSGEAVYKAAIEMVEQA